MDSLTLINQCFEKKILLNKDLLDTNNFENIPRSLDNLSNPNKLNNPPSLLILNKDNFLFLEQEIDWLKFDQLRVDLEKEKDTLLYASFLNDLKQNPPRFALSPSPQAPYPLTVLISHQNTTKKYQVKDFTKLFISRYEFLENILRNRPELTNTLSLNKILNKKEKGTVSLIGLVSKINQTKSGNLILTVEDLTGQINILINKNKTELYHSAKDLVLDEIIGVSGVNQGDIIFAENIIWPEFPLDKEFKKYPEEIYALFLSDIHIGSTNFLAEEFNKFLAWIKGQAGNEKQKKLAQKVKYLFIVGDLVDGVGIYPNQDKELLIKDIYQQYQTAADLLKKIPSHIHIVICPGNHDALYLAEPQSAFNPRYIQPLLQLPNIILVSNPALINICQTSNFPGFDVLLYHGYSFDYCVANVDSIRNAGGYSRADLIMKHLLKRRHLAPSFGSTPYFPTSEDHLIIKKIPDFFITGHIHYAIAANYHHITMISGSCWQSKTSFQEKLGHQPQPARLPLVNLKTREIKILKFM